jgi:hypothetical protein
VNSHNNASKFAIYLVKDTDYSYIDSYDWNASNDNPNTTPLWDSVKNKNSFKQKDKVNLNERMSLQGYKGARFFPYVVTVGNERIYLGAFFSQVTSMSPPENTYVFSPLNFDKTQSIKGFIYRITHKLYNIISLQL